MDEFIKKYKKERKQKNLLLADLIEGCTLLVYTIFCAFFSRSNVSIFLISFLIFCLISGMIKHLLKLSYIHGCNHKVSLKMLTDYKIYDLYNEKIESDNIKIIECYLEKMTEQEFGIFYNYLCDTKNNITFLKLRDILLIGLSCVIGASFDSNALISTILLSNAIISVAGCFLGVAPFYFIFFKINRAFVNWLNEDIIKSELIKYINKIKYNSSKKSHS